MANQRMYQSKFDYSEEFNQPSFNQYDNRASSLNSRGNLYNEERDYSSSSERQNSRGNFGNQSRNYSSNPDRQNDRGNFGNHGINYSSNSVRLDDRRNFRNQESGYSSNDDKGYSINQDTRFNSLNPERQNYRGNFGNQVSDYSSNSERQNDRGNFGNRGRDYTSNSERQNDRGNFNNQGRNYFSNPIRQYDRGHFDNQERDYSSNDDQGYSINQDEDSNFYKAKDYFHDNHSSRFNQSTTSTSSSSIKLGNSCDDEQIFFNDNKFSQYRTNTVSQSINQQKQDDNQPFSRSGQFGQVKKNTFDNNKFSRGRKTFFPAQRGNFEVESNFKKEGTEERGNIKEEDYNDEQTLTNTDQDMNDDECDGSDDEDMPVKLNAFVPSKELVEAFKYFPPSPEEMGDMFKELVIYFFYKIKNVEEKNPFVVICESFRRSDRFGPLRIEDGYNREDKSMKYCTIRWNGIMMVRGVGYYGNLKEPRVVAAVELINNLAMTCYTLKMKASYYSIAAVKQCLEKGTDESNTVRLVQPHEAPDLKSAQEYIVNFFKDDNNCELFFTVNNYIQQLKWWAKERGYENRFPHGLNVLGVSLKRTPQYWRDQIIASGKMENERFELIAPQGIGNPLLKDFDITSVIGRFRKSGFVKSGNEERTLYAHNDNGLNIAKVLPPWERRSGKGPSKSNKKKLNEIERAIHEGQPLASLKAFRHLGKHQKRKIRNKINKKKKN